MISFFRGIRRQSLVSHRFTKYILYAIGEIVLVMIGILLAIRINDYRKEDEMQKKEKFYLQSMLTDLDSAKIEMDRVITKTGEIRASSDSLIQFIQLDSIELNNMQISNHILVVFGYTYFSSSDGTISEIMSAGNLEIIRNDSIRQFVANWRTELDWIREYEELIQDIGDHLNILVDFSNLIVSPGLINNENRAVLMSDVKFRNLVISHLINAAGLHDAYKQQSEELIAMRDIIQKELQ